MPDHHGCPPQNFYEHDMHQEAEEKRGPELHASGQGDTRASPWSRGELRALTPSASVLCSEAVASVETLMFYFPMCTSPEHRYAMESPFSHQCVHSAMSLNFTPSFPAWPHLLPAIPLLSSPLNTSLLPEPFSTDSGFLFLLLSENSVGGKKFNR